MRAALVCLVVVVAACSSPARPAAVVEARPARAHAVTHVPASEPRGFIGVIAAHEQVEVSFPVAARLARVHVRVGEELAAGALVAELDPTELDSDIAGAEAALRESKAEAHQASASWRQARAHARQVRRLFAMGAVSPEERDAAIFDEERAGSAVARSRSLGEQRAAALTKLRLLRDRTELRAPLTGRVVARAYDEGALVPAAAAVVTIGSSAREARFAVPPEDLGGIGVGGEVAVIGPGGHCWRAPVSEVAPAVDTAMQMGVAVASLAGAAELPPAGTRVSVVAGSCPAVSAKPAASAASR